MENIVERAYITDIYESKKMNELVQKHNKLLANMSSTAWSISKVAFEAWTYAFGKSSKVTYDEVGQLFGYTKSAFRRLVKTGEMYVENTDRLKNYTPAQLQECFSQADPVEFLVSTYEPSATRDEIRADMKRLRQISNEADREIAVEESESVARDTEENTVVVKSITLEIEFESGETLTLKDIASYKEV